MLRHLAFSIALAAPPAVACDIALLLAVDVSGSVDASEYDIQMGGLSAALRDGIVIEALVRAEAAVSLMQWTGASRQEISIPWTRIKSPADVEALALAVDAVPRAWRRYSTAIGDALLRAADELEIAPLCKRLVVDVSGDGESNEGAPTEKGQRRMRELEATVNGLVIETDDDDLTGYYWENVITGEGAFVVTANGFEDYPARIRQKLIREVAQRLAVLDR